MSEISAISICSNAFLRLGDKPISSLTEDNDRAKLTNIYPVRRNALLRSHTWNCATKRVILSPSTTAPEFDYAYKFILPDDNLRILQVGKKGETLDYQIESGYILADTDVLPLRYIWLNDNEATWDAMLVEAMELAMVAAFAYPITLSTSKEKAAIDELAQYLKKVRAVDGVEQPPETLGDFRLLTSRYGSNWANVGN